MIQSDRSNEIYSFEMFDVLGKNVKSLKGISTKEFQISRNGLENGVYFYKINSAENTIAIGKLIVQ
ncbi:MAG: T9SS type A sorting domain-containing protein [Bacteroidetes bacterium]|nr:T9SS type A sorting domain-containing protein [Bacteroidota bacterium]